MPRFQPGNPGKPKGAKDHHPRSAKAAIIAIMERYASGDEYALTLSRGLASRPPHSLGYLKLITEQVAGMPDVKTALDHRIVLAARDVASSSSS